MTTDFNMSALIEQILADEELAYNLFGLASATVRLELPTQRLDLTIADGRVVRAGLAGTGDVALTIGNFIGCWDLLRQNPPPVGGESLPAAMMSGLRLTGDLATMIAPYQPAWERLLQLVCLVLRGPVERRPVSTEPFKDSDTAVGRYIYMEAGGVEYRIYYESAGTGPVPLLLLHTAGGDGRQYRHLLADPALQAHFTLIAFDLPYHGRSLPPTTQDWWTRAYRPTKQWLMEMVVAIADRLALDRPLFMGCSVGGQLALDLAAHHPDRFRGLIALNGWHDMEPFRGFSNDRFRTPAISPRLYASNCYGGTSPTAPEGNRRETYWIYASNAQGIYAGDNDYFLSEHDLRENGHLIDTARATVHVVSGEYDVSERFPAHGGAEVARRIPGVTYTVLEGLSHFAPSDDPVGFRDAMMPIFRQFI